MGSSNRRFNTVFAWTQTVQSLIDEPAKVTAHCGGCKSRYVDLERVRREQGPLFSFWNRHPPCPVCRRRVFFYAQRANVWKSDMENGPPGEVAELHLAWRAERCSSQGIEAAAS